MTSALEQGLVQCHCCHLLCQQTETESGQACCPRCHTPLHPRIPMSIQRTAACLIAAIILLVPANIYPISYFTTNGQTQADTIFSGVMSLSKAGMTPIAIIVFTASVVIPVAKIFGIGLITLSLKFRILRDKRSRLVMYRSIEWIGKWSMLDLFVISLMAALVNVGQLLDLSCGPAATPFALVILLTVLATESFDTRLIWDDVIE